jgi:hypothetical protein
MSAFDWVAVVVGALWMLIQECLRHQFPVDSDLLQWLIVDE